MLKIHFLQFYVFAVCIKLFTIITVIVYYKDYYMSQLLFSDVKHVDYVIVGSGTAGSLIAHRIAAETNHTYIILEAGGKRNFLFDIPLVGPLLQGTLYDWQYETVPQKNACLAMKNQKCKWPMGKIIGGSAMLNNMIHIRGNISHYINWFQGKYSFSHIEKQFEYIERNILPVNEVKYESNLADVILEAAKELGYDNVDVNKEFKAGFMKSKVNQKDGSRWSTSHTFLVNDNDVITNAFVEKVLINEEKAAYGVQYAIGSKIYKVIAEKGVILSAGTIGTPKILMLSGIGPYNHLSDLKIPIIKNLPVGQNLQDHVTTGLDLINFNKSIGLSLTDVFKPMGFYKYFTNGSGSLTSPGCEVVGFLSTKNEKETDIQFMVLPVGLTADKGSHLKDLVNIKDIFWDEYFSKQLDKHTASIIPILMHPKSRGEVKLKSIDPYDNPLVNPKYFHDESDLKTLREGLKLVKKFFESNAMKAAGAFINPNSIPGCENHKLFSDQYFDCYIKHITLTSYHPVGTCKMGSKNDHSSVVGTDFSVIGIKNLFISDGSVLPYIPSGNINAVIALMASLFFENHFTTTSNNYTEKLDNIGVCELNDYLDVVFNVQLICYPKTMVLVK